MQFEMEGYPSQAPATDKFSLALIGLVPIAAILYFAAGQQVLYWFLLLLILSIVVVRWEELARAGKTLMQGGNL